ncbi:MAG: chorismate synthase [Acidimicrobiia bacterium]|nr:chorismate synthase [Acidimicrobiia bacterium]MDX2466889.1 chorismate synthase [Acidimicrobiia bacterium]
MLRFLTAGESHGPGLVTIVEGLPSGLPVAAGGLGKELARRRLGYGRGRRMALEKDEIEIMGGVRFGKTLGSPVAIVIRNTEWPKWQEEMSATEGTSRRPLQTPRPGHADLAGMIKYDTRDARDILERASARETAARTVVGYLAKLLLAEIDVRLVSHVVAIGNAAVGRVVMPTPADQDTIDASPVRALDETGAAAMIAAIEAAKEDRNTLGGVFEVLAYGLPIGLGSHVHWDRRLDAALAEAMMSIQAIKGVEIGDGYEMAATPGSSAHDEIYHDNTGFSRKTNRAGGLEGGMTIGDVVRIRAAMKPISTVMRPLDTVNVVTKEAEKAFRERSDVCAVPAAAIVGEQMVAFTLANEVQRKFGGDTVAELRGAVDAYRKHVTDF